MAYLVPAKDGFHRWTFAINMMIGDTICECQLNKILSPTILFFLWELLYQKKIILYYYYIWNFINKKFVEICFLSLYKYLRNVLDFASWPTKSKIFTLWPFTKISLLTSVLDSREILEINTVKKSTVWRWNSLKLQLPLKNNTAWKWQKFQSNYPGHETILIYSADLVWRS